MRFEVEEEFEELKRLLSENKMVTYKSNCFLEEDDYEDDYSNNEIQKLQSEFIDEAVKYLKKHYKGQYVITKDWCVRVMTLEMYEDKKPRFAIIC